jgi:phosphohistidine phosphatase
MNYNVYLIRHGIAVDRRLDLNDEIRALTPQGRQKTRQVARKMLETGLHFDTILTSPLLRARQTAEILQEVGLGYSVEDFPALAPDGNLQDWLDWWGIWKKRDYRNPIALVGHQPDLGHWAESLLWGTYTDKLILKKAGAIGLRLSSDKNPLGKCQLFLLTSPKWTT